MLTALYVLVIALDLLFREAWAIAVPPNAPSGAAAVDPSVLSVSIEFFTLPGYTQIEATSNCLENLAQLRGGARPAIRIGGTTQDRATYDPELQSAVNYTVASPADAPDSLTYGPSFFTLAAQLQSDAVTLGLNRQLNNQAASLAAAVQAKNTMDNLFALELGNEPEFCVRRCQYELAKSDEPFAYCFWGTSSVFAPYYGAAFVSDFLGTDGAGVAMLDNGTSPLAAYAVYSSNSSLLRLLLINSNYYDGTASATRSSSTFTLTGLQARSAAGKRLTAPSATALSNVTISGSAFSTTCTHTGSAVLEDVQIAPNGTLSVSLLASEALIVVL
ncbi:hypothetical protein EUX98_g6485 [Antrodiella citrinella]|uniref:Beta-glucuronidase C-terminal domain-containing protein n=1 Tax=Antrodiella citrinella TaxID=2447956 RepID=A0A4S4MQZ6_9APHY|nr:hypothetical protein EUX98_g6485 [Antrodiella citrinella]